MDQRVLRACVTCGVRPVDDLGSFVQLSALSAHQYSQSELTAFDLMHETKKQVISSYLSRSGSRYHLHQELVQDESSCWLCTDCTDAKSHVSALCVRNVDYGWMRRVIAVQPSLLEECIARRSRPYRYYVYAVICINADSAQVQREMQRCVECRVQAEIACCMCAARCARRAGTNALALHCICCS